MTLELTDQQIDSLADAVEARIAARQSEQRRKPLTVTEFAAESRLSKSQVYRWIEAGTLRRVENLSKVLIPASELDRFQ